MAIIEIPQMSQLGSQQYRGRVGTIGHIGTVAGFGSLGRVNYVERMGTLGHAGTVAQVTYVPRIGSIGHLGTLATGPQGTLGPARWYKGGSVGASQWDRIHTEAGSFYVGSFFNVERFKTKTIAVRSSSSGTLALVVGLNGTFITGATGTYATFRLGQGSYNVFSFTEAVRFLKPIVKPGSFGTGKGTLTLMHGFQPN